MACIERYKLTRLAVFLVDSLSGLFVHDELSTIFIQESE